MGIPISFCPWRIDVGGWDVQDAGLQTWHDRRLKALAQTDEAKLETQSPAEQEKSLEGSEVPEEGGAPRDSLEIDVSSGESPEGTDTPMGSNDGSSLESDEDRANELQGSDDRPGHAELSEQESKRNLRNLRRERDRDIRLGVLETISSRTPDGFTFRSTPKLTLSGGSTIYMDGLLEADDEWFDWVVEIRIARFIDDGRLGAASSVLWVDQLISKAARYGTTRGRNTKGWLIVVVDTEDLPRSDAIASEVESLHRRLNARIGNTGQPTVIVNAAINSIDPTAVVFGLKS